MKEDPDLAEAVRKHELAGPPVRAVTYDIIECYVSDATPDKVVKGASAQAVLDSAEKLYVAEHGGDETVETIHLKRSRGAKLPAESGIPGVVFHRIDVDNKAGSFLKTVHKAMLDAFMCPGYTGFSDAATLAGTGEIGLRRLTAAEKKLGMRAPKNGDYSTSWINRIYQHLMNKAGAFHEAVRRYLDSLRLEAGGFQDGKTEEQLLHGLIEVHAMRSDGGRINGAGVQEQQMAKGASWRLQVKFDAVGGIIVGSAATQPTSGTNGYNYAIYVARELEPFLTRVAYEFSLLDGPLTASKKRTAKVEKKLAGVEKKLAHGDEKFDRFKKWVEDKGIDCSDFESGDDADGWAHGSTSWPSYSEWRLHERREVAAAGRSCAARPAVRAAPP
jgi:hypothetical protein